MCGGKSVNSKFAEAEVFLAIESAGKRAAYERKERHTL
jgi:hypothetical protein